MLVRSSQSATFVTFRIAVVVVLVGLYASYFAALVTNFIAIIFISVGHIIFAFFTTTLANFGANVPVRMRGIFALLAAQITVLIAAILVAMLTALAGKTAKVALAVTDRGILVSFNLSQSKALVALLVAGVIVAMIASFAKFTAQVTSSIAKIIIYVSYIAQKTAICAVRVAVTFKIMGLGDSFRTADVTFSVTRIRVKMRGRGSDKSARVAVYITFVCVPMRLRGALIPANVALIIAGIVVGMPCPVGYKSAEGAFSLAGVFNIMRYVLADKSAAFTLRVAGRFKAM